jgi:hypothetical protein
VTESFLQDLWNLAKQAGPFSTLIMLFLWWRADTERLRLQAERDALLERTITSILSATHAIQEATNLIKSIVTAVVRERA